MLVCAEEAFVVELFLIKPINQVKQVVLLLSNPTNSDKYLHLVNLPEQLSHRIVEGYPISLNNGPEVLLLERILDVLPDAFDVYFPLGNYGTGLGDCGSLFDKYRCTASKWN